MDMSVDTVEKPRFGAQEITPPETEEERRVRHAEILEKYDKNPELKRQVCDKIFDIAGHYVNFLKDTEYAEHEGFAEHMALTTAIVDEFAHDKIPVTAVHAAMFHDFAQRLASPYQEVRDAATLALMEFYELPDDIVAVEEKNYIAEILRDLNDLGSQAYRHRKSLDKEKYERNAQEAGVDSNDVHLGYVLLTNGVAITEELPRELWGIDIPLVNIETLKQEIHATNIEANVIIAAESIAHIAAIDSQDYAKQYRAYVEFIAMHGPVLELLTFDALGGIAGRSTALRVMHEKLGHTEALDKAREILDDVADFGGIEGAMQLLYVIGEHGITNIEVVYPDANSAKDSEIKVGDGGSIDAAQYMDVRITYTDVSEAGETIEITKRIIIRRKGLGSLAHKMMSGGDYTVDNPPADTLAATEIVGYVDAEDEKELSQKDIKRKEKKDRRQLARNFVEELSKIADLKESGKLSLRSTIKKGEVRQPIFVQGGAKFKQRIRDAFKEYEVDHGAPHPLVDFVEYKEKDTAFEVAKFMCEFIVGDKKVALEKQFVTDLTRKKTRIDDRIAHVAYKAGSDQAVPENSYAEINKRMSRLNNKSLEVNDNPRPDGREKISGHQFWLELQYLRTYIPKDLRERYEKIKNGEEVRRFGNTVLATALEDYEIAT